MKILLDHDIEQIDITHSAEALRNYLIGDAEGRNDSPPRHSAILGNDRLIFTIGGDSQTFGFRTYTSRAGLSREREDQVVACWDRSGHELMGIALGQSLGAWRTGILGGLCRQAMSTTEHENCGIIGTGRQAATQARATAALGPPRRFLVFSRNADHRLFFAKDLEKSTGIPTIALSSAREVVEQSRSLILATNSTEPVIDLAWLERCQHVTTVGPKSVKEHEVPAEIAAWASILISDSPQQITVQGPKHFLASDTKFDEIRHLGHVLTDKRQSWSTARSLYLSAGLAGTEVALLAALLQP